MIARHMCRRVVLWLAWLGTASAAAASSDPMDAYNVVWGTPSKTSAGSMPIGNGDVGLNVWVEQNGDLRFCVSKTDAWSGNNRLLKLGRVRIGISPNPFANGLPFRQTLRLRQGEIEIVAGNAASAVTIIVWVDANRPVIHIDTTSERPFEMRVDLEPWRTTPRELKDKEGHSAYCMFGGPEPMIVGSDKVLDRSTHQLVWFHRNESSCWPATLKLQGLESLMATSRDPLLKRTFGAAIQGDGLVKVDAKTLRSDRPAKCFAISIYPLTQQTGTIDAWLAALNQQIKVVDAVGVDDARRAHRQWWDGFWNRSWIRITGFAGGGQISTNDLHMISQRYTLQRHMSACAGRGAYPIKFNGSIFNVDWRFGKENYDADYRRWGGCYWFQNTRLIYWPMLASGDFEMMQPLFRMFIDALPLARERVRRYFGHKGAMFPETMTSWGAYANSNFGWDRKGKHVSHCDNRYIRWYWSGQLELLAMMLDYHAFTQDAAFARSTLVPFAGPVVRFFDQHYKRDAVGKIRFAPAQALETWHEAVNPLPEIAGLRFCLPRLLGLPKDLTGEQQRRDWMRLIGELPDLPTRPVNGKLIFAAADKLIGPIRNSENPELYAIFPFRLYGVGKPDLEFARRTFGLRRVKGNHGWRQDDTQAAFLGLADQAARHVTDRIGSKFVAARFPVFWGPNFDWIPDQDHGSNAILALQTMLVQCEGKTIRLLPAWPKEWNVCFKLHAPYKTTIEGDYRDGRLKRVVVTPRDRAGDVVDVSAR